jgi:dTDP-glucose 4,6-dehydratase
MLHMQEKFGFKMVFTSSSEIYGDLPEVMRETVTDEQAIKQMNDYAISKAANELQILNAQTMFNSPTVTVRLFNVYGPGEYYTPYRSAIAIFIYRALHNLPYTVYTSHRRSSLYIDDCTACLAKIAHNFQSGEVYNIAHGETHNMKDVSDLILDYLGKNDDQVEYLTEERRTTGIKRPDISKARRDLDFYPQVHLEEGIAKTIEWMKHVYLDSELLAKDSRMGF